MIDLLCGSVIGGSVTFMVAVMFMSSRTSGKIRMRAGTLVSYYDNRGQEITVELGNDLHENDEYAVVRKPDTKLEFVLGSNKIV